MPNNDDASGNSMGLLSFDQYAQLQTLQQQQFRIQRQLDTIRKSQPSATATI